MVLDSVLSDFKEYRKGGYIKPFRKLANYVYNESNTENTTAGNGGKSIGEFVDQFKVFLKGYWRHCGNAKIKEAISVLNEY